MLNEKETLFNWVTPNVSNHGRSVTEDLRVNTKHEAIYLGNPFIEQYFKGTDPNDIRIALVNMDSAETPFIVINPNKGVPFFKLRKEGKGSAPRINNKFLTKLFVTKFKIREGAIALFDLKPFQSFNGMMFFSINIR